MPASQTRDKDALTQEGVEKVLDELKKQFKFIICDSPAGIERGALLALHFADEAVVVTNPEVSSVRDSDRIVGVLNSRSKRAALNLELKKHLLVTRYAKSRVQRGEMLSVEDIQEILALPVLGIIPESASVLNASNNGIPVTLGIPSDAKRAYQDAVSRLLGEEVQAPKDWKSKLFGGLNIFNRSPA